MAFYHNLNCSAHGQRHQRLTAQAMLLHSSTLHGALGPRTRKARRKVQRLLAAAQRNGAWTNGGPLMTLPSSANPNLDRSMFDHF